MGFIGSLFGMRSGSSGGAGLNYRAQQTPIMSPLTSAQNEGAYNQSHQALNQQQAFLQALQGQNGITNQSNVFAQQQALANQLQGIASGTGPNPALAQLNQTTGQNIANQSALMAGQRGSGANSGLIARQIGMQGGNLQQQAAGQAATLSAQQQLGALGALQQQQGAMGNLASQQIGQQQQGLGLLNQGAQSEQQMLLNALANYNTANVSQQNAANSSNADVSKVAAQGQEGLFGGALKGLSGSSVFGARGGEVPGFADGGTPSLGNFSYSDAMGPTPSAGPSSFVANFLKPESQTQGQPQPSASSMTTDNPGANSIEEGMSDVFAGGVKMAKKVAPLALAAFASKGGQIVGEQLAAEGKMVPGQAKVSGNSLANDVVPAMLSPKEIVIPRSITMSENAPEKAKQFVAAILARNGMRK